MAIALLTPTEGWRVKPAYTFSQAARLAGVSSKTVRRWVYGDIDYSLKPVFGTVEEDNRELPTVSFLQLAEIVVVAGFRQRRISLQRMRRAHQFATEQFGLEYPFATLKMKTDGRYILLEFGHFEPGESFLALDAFGQLTLPGTVTEAIEGFEFDPTWAVRWFPVGDKAPIVVDPRMGAARPTVMDRGVTIEAIYRRWKDGQSYEEISEEYELAPRVVEDVLRFADKIAA
jgi:uncharacterized protein (DUF433 family)